MSLPGKLTIKFDSLNSGTGVIFRRDSQYVFQDNQLIRKNPRVNDLLVLGFDFYEEKSSVTIDRLKKQGFDLGELYETVWRGREIYVIGASDGEDKSPQFWIDKKRLYFVRLIRSNEQNGVVQEMQFNNYGKMSGGWVAGEVIFSVDGKPVLRERYSNIKTPLSLRDSIFDTIYFKDAVWEK